MNSEFVVKVYVSYTIYVSIRIHLCKRAYVYITNVHSVKQIQMQKYKTGKEL